LTVYAHTDVQQNTQMSDNMTWHNLYWPTSFNIFYMLVICRIMNKLEQL